MKSYDHFLFPATWWTTLQAVDASTREAVVSAICAYAFDGVDAADLQPLAQGLYIAFKAALEADKAKFDTIRSKRSEAGKASAQLKKERREQIQQVLTNSTSVESVNTGNKTNTCQQTQPIINNIDNITSFSSLHSARACEEKKKKEDFLIEIIKEMLRRGASEPKNEAERFWEYNDQAGWVQTNGRAVKNPVLWAKKWTIKTGTNDSVRKYADVYIDLLKAAGLRDEEDMLDAFDGIEETANQVVVGFKTKYALKKFTACEDDDFHLECLKTIVGIHFPNKTISYRVKK